jgi:hypothetical protein|tara:strand:+ start:1519 stop:1917 length:399 start_codon:yes stop_codon:yes gene_type:complete
MRSEGEVRHKLKQVQYRHLKRALRKFFPSNEEWDREAVQKVKTQFKELLATSTIHEIAKDFPDVAALMWVLNESGESEDTLVAGASLVGSLGGVFLWADTPEQATKVREILDSFAAQETEPKKKGWFAGWFA